MTPSPTRILIHATDFLDFACQVADASGKSGLVPLATLATAIGAHDFGSKHNTVLDQETGTRFVWANAPGKKSAT